MASIQISQDFINEQLAAYSKSELVRDLKVTLDADQDRLYLRGKLQVPLEDLQAVNLDPKLGAYRFQAAIKLGVTKEGYLILEFPLAETYFYPDGGRDIERERVLVPVQLLSLGLASVRGYLAALSGDFTGLDRKAAKLDALLKATERSIPIEKNPDAREALVNQRDSLRLQAAAVPIERRRLQAFAKTLGKVLGFTGEKELDLNEGLSSLKNALILKVRLSQLTPYLSGTELGGFRVRHERKDGGGQNYFSIDLSSTKFVPKAPRAGGPRIERVGLKHAPALLLRLNQSLFESSEALTAERLGVANLRDIDFQLKDDGLHVYGTYRTLLIFNVSFETIIDFVTTGLDTFEVRVRELKAAGFDLGFMTRFVLESMKRRLDRTLKGTCQFEYLGKVSDSAQALRVTVEPKKLVPAFPDLHLIDVDVRDREFVLKVGRP